jgi:hypothetical protein
MFVALVIYNSHNGVENKLFSPEREVTVNILGGSFKTYRVTAFPTLEEAQTALNEAIAEPFTKSIQTNGYRALIVNAETGETVSNTVVPAVATESAAVQAN